MQKNLKIKLEQLSRDQLLELLEELSNVPDVQKMIKAMIMACVPMVVCITIFSVLTLPCMVPDGPAGNYAPGGSNEHIYGSMGNDGAAGLFAGSVELSGNGISRFYTSAEDVQCIMRLLRAITAGSEASGGDAIGDFVANENVSTSLEGSCKEKEYQILVKGSDGSITEYWLAGSLLIEQSTQRMFHMGEDTFLELKNALGIPLY